MYRNMNKDTDKNTRRGGVGGWFLAMARVFRREFSLVFSDLGIILFFFVLPLAYPVTYTLIYNPEIVTDLPVAVVDHSRTADSRALVQAASAAPSIQIYAQCADMDEAKELFASNKVFAIIEIPADYARKIGRGEQATVPMYFDVSLLLRYRALLSSVTDLQMKLTQEITGTRLETMGASTLGIDGGLPVNSHSSFLGDPGQGFASFVMPGVFILILQQSMVLGICMIAGSSKERRRLNGGIDPRTINGVPASATIWGKALCYMVLYLPSVLYVVKVLPEMFALPHSGAAVDYLLFLVPLMLGSAMFGQALSGLCTERESCFIVVVFTSIIFLFLSGLTWPRYAMNQFWIWLGNLVPATWGVEGFIRINSNAATLAETVHPFHMLWILAAGYFLVAWGVQSYVERYYRRNYAIAA